MERKSKIKELLGRLNKLQGIPDGEVMNFADSVIREEMRSAADSIRSSPQMKMLDGIYKKLEQFKSEFNLEPISEEFDALKQEVEDLRAEINEATSQQNKALQPIREAIMALQEEEPDETEGKIGELQASIEKLKNELSDDSAEKEQSARFEKSLVEITNRLAGFEGILTQQKKESDSAFEKTKQESADSLKSLRTDILNRLNTGGGNANRQINVNSSVMSKKYTDINFLNSTTIGFTATNDDTNKQVIIRASILSGAGGSALTVKESDGVPTVNNVNTIVVSNGTLTDNGGGQVTVTTGGGGGGITRTTSVISVSSTLAAAGSTDYVFFVNVGSAQTLPTAINNSNLYTIKNQSASSILVITSAGQTIDGSSSALLPTQNESLSFVSNGSVWGVV